MENETSTSDQHRGPALAFVHEVVAPIITDIAKSLDSIILDWWGALRPGPAHTDAADAGASPLQPELFTCEPPTDEEAPPEDLYWPCSLCDDLGTHSGCPGCSRVRERWLPDRSF